MQKAKGAQVLDQLNFFLIQDLHENHLVFYFSPANEDRQPEVFHNTKVPQNSHRQIKSSLFVQLCLASSPQIFRIKPGAGKLLPLTQETHFAFANKGFGFCISGWASQLHEAVSLALISAADVSSLHFSHAACLTFTAFGSHSTYSAAWGFSCLIV